MKLSILVATLMAIIQSSYAVQSSSSRINYGVNSSSSNAKDPYRYEISLKSNVDIPRASAAPVGTITRANGSTFYGSRLEGDWKPPGVKEGIAFYDKAYEYYYDGNVTYKRTPRSMIAIIVVLTFNFVCAIGSAVMCNNYRKRDDKTENDDDYKY